MIILNQCNALIGAEPVNLSTRTISVPQKKNRVFGDRRIHQGPSSPAVAEASSAPVRTPPNRHPIITPYRPNLTP